MHCARERRSHRILVEYAQRDLNLDDFRDGGFQYVKGLCSAKNIIGWIAED